MKLTEARITILVDQEKTTITLYDYTSHLTIAEITLTPTELSSALSRLSFTTCKAEVLNFDKLNKIHENEYFEFEIPKELKSSAKTNELYELALKEVPEGWQPDKYFGAQNSFFEKNNKTYARCTIRRWI